MEKKIFYLNSSLIFFLKFNFIISSGFNNTLSVDNVATPCPLHQHFYVNGFTESDFATDAALRKKLCVKTQRI